jgi:uncharacterized membrane protein
MNTLETIKKFRIANIIFCMAFTAAAIHYVTIGFAITSIIYYLASCIMFNAILKKTENIKNWKEE